MCNTFLGSWEESVSSNLPSTFFNGMGGKGLGLEHRRLVGGDSDREDKEGKGLWVGMWCKILKDRFFPLLGF